MAENKARKFTIKSANNRNRIPGLLRRVKKVFPSRLGSRLQPGNISADITTNRQYHRINQHLIQFHRSGGAKIAVVIHLYYIENWALFKSALLRINEPFDLFVTLPSNSRHFTRTIQKTYPQALILETPNRGRDVLPFLRVAAQLKTLGYEYVLKIHSKKSIHRTDGQDWLEGMVRCLVPDNSGVMKELLKVLSDGKTGVVGPKGCYTSLKVNFEANGPHMERIISELFSEEVSHSVLQTHRNEFGFFAGTMFWARLEALKPILEKRIKTNVFENEDGQIDSTLAHALERLFCLVPEINDKKMYEISNDGLKSIEYQTGAIPDWSDVYIPPKN